MGGGEDSASYSRGEVVAPPWLSRWNLILAFSACVCSVDDSLRRAAWFVLFAVLCTDTWDELLGFFLGVPLNGKLQNQSCAFFSSLAPASGTVHSTQNSVSLCWKNKQTKKVIFIASFQSSIITNYNSEVIWENHSTCQMEPFGKELWHTRVASKTFWGL